MSEMLTIERQEEALASLRPEALLGDEGSHQQRKSLEMRTRIIESAIDCLVEKGYAGLSANDAARRAGASRGAVHHHFSNRMQLVAAVVEFTFYRRMELFLDLYNRSAKPSDPDRAIRAAALLFWKTLRTREYAAYIELALASRTDEEVKRHFLETSQRFDRVWTEQMSAMFPHWREPLRIVTDFALSAYTGLIIQQGVLGTGRRSAKVRELITTVITKLQRGELP